MTPNKSSWVITRFTIILLTFICFPSSSLAYDFYYDGLYYNIISTTELTCEVTYRDANDKTTYKGVINIPSEVTYKNKKLTVIRIGTVAFSRHENVTAVNIPSTVRTIDKYAFSSCYGLTSITIPASVEYIRDGALAYCKNLTEIIFEDSDKFLTLDAQEDLYGKHSPFVQSGTSSKVKSLYIGRDLYLGCNETFDVLTNLTTLYIGKNVTQIAAGNFKKCSFYNCNSLRTIISYTSIPPILNNYWGDRPFFSNSVLANAKLKVPKGALKRYEESDDWVKFWDISEGDWESSIATSISLSKPAIELSVGESAELDAYISPETLDKKILSWQSSNPSIVSVDAGLVTALSVGNAEIICKTTDGSALEAICKVSVLSESGIKDVIADKTAYVKIFNMQGILVYEGIYSDANLVPDYYIVAYDGKNIKVKVE